MRWGCLKKAWLKQVNAPYMDALKEAASAVVESGWYIRGSYCEKFEKEFASYCGFAHGVGVGTLLFLFHLNGY